MDISQMINIFLNPTQHFQLKERKFSDELIKTHFEDWEALSLLAGIINIPKARKIWYKYFDNIELTKEDIKFAHQVSNELKVKHNDEVLNVLLSCPPKPFQAGNAKELFSELDLAKDKIENPAIRFLSAKENRFLKVMYKTYGVETPEYVLIKDAKAGDYFVSEKYKF